MYRRAWQAGMIRLARSHRLKTFMQGRRATSRLAARYVGGATAAAGTARLRDLLAAGVRGSLFFLGEYVDTQHLVGQNVSNIHAAAGTLSAAGLDVHVSVDPTQIGHMIDPDLAAVNMRTIAETVARAGAGRPGVHMAMLDMEDQSVVDATIALHDRLWADGLPVALTLQAYLFRTEADLRGQIRAGGRVRLVHGAFAAGRDIAWTSRRAAKASFRRLIELMFAAEARDSGFYPIIATHDDHLQRYAVERAEAGGWRPGDYEFEQVLGIRDALMRRRAAEGHRARLYVPFGDDWWPHAMRRIGEAPRNAWLLARSVAPLLASHRRGAVEA